MLMAIDNATSGIHECRNFINIAHWVVSAMVVCINKDIEIPKTQVSTISIGSARLESIKIKNEKIS